MRSWDAVHLASLVDRYGAGPAVRVHDSATGALLEVDPEDTARLFVCGITPYDATHLGHAATYVAFDLLNRAWRDAGLQVHYTQNVTDVDDPLLERATQTGVDWTELAERETELFRTDMRALAVLPPDDYIGVVEALDLVIGLIGRLEETGATYRVGDDLYFDVHADADFGSLGHLDAATMRQVFAERGGDPDRDGKRDPLDCLLWQAARPGEPSWDSPWGSGRPGWHVECAAIALEHLGTTFDVQGGGSDLVFPHHEMSAAQSRVATKEPFARAFVHAGMVGYEGEKMSKSKGNLVLVSKLREAGHDPAAIRLVLLNRHYRTDWEYTDADLELAERRLALWREAAIRPTASSAQDLVFMIRQALADDLDAPRALRAVDHWAQVSGDDPDGGVLAVQAIDSLLGVKIVPD